VSAYDAFLQIRTRNTPETIKFLEDREWDLNAFLNNFKWTALHLAAYQGDSELVEYLIRKGADLEISNSTGFTPFKLAEYKGNTEICRILSSGAERFIEMPMSSSSA